MKNLVQDVLAQMKGIWSRLDGGQRLVVSAVALATVVGLGTIVWFAGRPSYETVFTAKTNDEIARAKSALQRVGVSYNVDDSGRAFRVERGKIGLANMAIAEEGLLGMQTPTIGGGTSLIEDAETKSFKLDAASRAQAAAAIQALDGVLGATVTASRPRRTMAFRDRANEQRASATVVLRLRPGAQFEPIARSAASIASSQLMVPLENIDIVSTAGGQRWHYDPDREAGGGTSEFLALQRNMSGERTRLAQERLDQIWPGKTAVQVTVELDPSWEVRSEKVVPTEAIVRSEKFTKDTTDSSAGKTADADGKSNSKNEKRDREFVTEIGERRVGKLMPEIKRIGVALLYDRTLEQAQGFNKEDLIKTVKSIVGWDQARDVDAFSTLVGDFAPVEDVIVADGGPGFGEIALRWGPTIGQVLGVLVVVMFLRGLFKRSGGQPAAAAAGADASMSKEVPIDQMPPEDQQKRLRREIERSIANDPAALAKMLETWLLEKV
jgi:flagellar M-ring protein FliF